MVLTLNFVTDRTQNHVALRKKLLQKGWSNLSSAEQEQWYGEAAKGAYNYSDLNRVETGVKKVSDVLHLQLTTKTDWTMWDIPTKSSMDRYLENLAKIREQLTHIPNLPTLPSSMDNLTYEMANNIEKVLVIAIAFTERFIQSGEIYSGEV